jgi:hypothetical protein
MRACMKITYKVRTREAQRTQQASYSRASYAMCVHVRKSHTKYERVKHSERSRLAILAHHMLCVCMYENHTKYACVKHSEGSI